MLASFHRLHDFSLFFLLNQPFSNIVDLHVFFCFRCWLEGGGEYDGSDENLTSQKSDFWKKYLKVRARWLSKVLISFIRLLLWMGIEYLAGEGAMLKILKN